MYSIKQPLLTITSTIESTKSSDNVILTSESTNRSNGFVFISTLACGIDRSFNLHNKAMDGAISIVLSNCDNDTVFDFM